MEEHLILFILNFNYALPLKKNNYHTHTHAHKQYIGLYYLNNTKVLMQNTEAGFCIVSLCAVFCF